MSYSLACKDVCHAVVDGKAACGVPEYTLSTGLEKGTVQHVPSTHDLLLAQGLDPVRLKGSASRLAASMHAMDENYEPDSPKSDTSSGPVTCFRPFHVS